MSKTKTNKLYTMKEYKDEEWRSVGVVNGFDFDGLYEVSNYGRVRSLDKIVTYQNAYGTHSYSKKGRVLKLIKHSQGYQCVNLWLNGQRKISFVHRLVASAFLNKENEKLE